MWHARTLLVFQYDGPSPAPSCPCAPQDYILKTRFYFCKCERCRQPDLARSMHCNSCGNDTVLHYPAADCWVCATSYCSRQYSNAEMPLSAESLLVEYINTLWNPKTSTQVCSLGAACPGDVGQPLGPEASVRMQVVFPPPLGDRDHGRHPFGV